MTYDELAAWHAQAPESHRKRVSDAADVAVAALYADGRCPSGIEYAAAITISAEIEAIGCGALGFVEAQRAAARAR